MAHILKILIPEANRIIRLFFCVPFIVYASQAIAQYEVTKDLHIVYNQLLDFQLDSAAHNLKNLPQSPYSFYLESLLTTARIYINDDQEDYNESKYLESELHDKLKELGFQEPYSNFLQAELKLQWAVLKLKNGEDFSAFWNLKKAYHLAKESVHQNPDFLPSYKTLGTLHVLFGVLPDKYNWILSLFGIEGDVQTGLVELEKVYRSTHFLSMECGSTIALLHAYLLNAPNTGAELMATIHQNNRRLLIDYAYSLILIKNAQSDKALDVIKDSGQTHAQPFLLAQLYYVKGEILLQKGLMDEAIDNYSTFLTQHKGKNLVKDAYYKIGVCHLIQGKNRESSYYFEKARNGGWAKNEADQNAQKALESTYFSKKELYQLRYATDGGYYETALDIQKKIDTVGMHMQQKCEFLYRSSRLFHKTGNTKKAIIFYKKTIAIQGGNDWYYAPNSALQLGLIYMSVNKDEAKRYLNLVGNYRGYPYQYSIRQKTKATQKKLH